MSPMYDALPIIINTAAIPVGRADPAEALLVGTEWHATYVMQRGTLTPINQDEPPRIIFTP